MCADGKTFIAPFNYKR